MCNNPEHVRLFNKRRFDKIKELKLIREIENSPLLVLLGYYPEDDLSRPVI